METKFKNNPHLRIILKEMCKRVGADFNKINFNKHEWFMKHTWTEKELMNFKEWFINYLYENTEARKEIMMFPLKNKMRIRRTASWFILDYGWKTKWDGMNKKKIKK